MAIRDALLPEFDHELANTRKELERVPDDKFDWKPHAKSFTLGRLSSHIAEIPRWVEMTLTKESLDLNPPDGTGYKAPEIRTRADLLALFDASVAGGRAALAAADDACFGKTWSLLNGGKTVLSMPRAAVLRGFVLSHIIHHRAQLGVYLRLLDIPVPSIYGPSADEAAF